MNTIMQTFKLDFKTDNTELKDTDNDYIKFKNK